ncbi:MAG: GDP-L-fucose synthase family protein [Bacteroidales bacterium]
MKKDAKIYIAGHMGMVGSAIRRKLEAEAYKNLVFRNIVELDLIDQQSVEQFFLQEKPEYVFIAAAKVGGIYANNTYRAQFLYDNLMIQSNIIHASWRHGVKKLLFLGSSCIYPKMAPQPLKEEYLLTGELEPTNEPYAIAKIAGIKMCENYYRQYGCDYLSVMPTNLYGPNDNYNLETSHVLPALIRKMYLSKCLEDKELRRIEKNLGFGSSDDCKENVNIKELKKYGISWDSNTNKVKLVLWGSGNPYREFMHVDDMASACVYIMKNVSAEQLYGMGITHLNIGNGKDHKISEIAQIIVNIAGFRGDLIWDTTKPDGTPRKLLDVSRLRELGWTSSIPAEEGIKQVFGEYQQHMILQGK